MNVLRLPINSLLLLWSRSGPVVPTYSTTNQFTLTCLPIYRFKFDFSIIISTEVENIIPGEFFFNNFFTLIVGRLRNTPTRVGIYLFLLFTTFFSASIFPRYRICSFRYCYFQKYYLYYTRVIHPFVLSCVVRVIYICGFN